MPNPRVFDLDRFKLNPGSTWKLFRRDGRASFRQEDHHWIWWVFLRLAGLGSSAMSVRYALAGRDEACTYLGDDVLRARLLEAVA